MLQLRFSRNLRPALPLLSLQVHIPVHPTCISFCNVKGLTSQRSTSHATGTWPFLGDTGKNSTSSSTKFRTMQQRFAKIENLGSCGSVPGDICAISIKLLSVTRGLSFSIEVSFRIQEPEFSTVFDFLSFTILRFSVRSSDTRRPSSLFSPLRSWVDV